MTYRAWAAMNFALIKAFAENPLSSPSQAMKVVDEMCHKRMPSFQPRGFLSSFSPDEPISSLLRYGSVNLAFKLLQVTYDSAGSSDQQPIPECDQFLDIFEYVLFVLLLYLQGLG